MITVTQIYYQRLITVTEPFWALIYEGIWSKPSEISYLLHINGNMAFTFQIYINNSKSTNYLPLSYTSTLLNFPHSTVRKMWCEKCLMRGEWWFMRGVLWWFMCGWRWFISGKCRWIVKKNPFPCFICLSWFDHQNHSNIQSNHCVEFHCVKQVINCENNTFSNNPHVKSINSTKLSLYIVLFSCIHDKISWDDISTLTLISKLWIYLDTS